MLKTIVGFLSREHGLNVLKTLIEKNQFKIITVFTHKFNPKSQDETKGIRKDFQKFVDLCKQENIELVTIDSKNSEIKCPNCDFIIEVSWRYLISPKITKKANILAFGIHRGKLPDYAGAEPIKQAIQKNEKEYKKGYNKMQKHTTNTKGYKRIQKNRNTKEYKRISKEYQKNTK